MYLIGLTGGAGTGKNAVASVMEDLGANVIDSNKLANKLLQFGKPTYDEVVKIFGSKVIDFQESIDKLALTRMTLEDSEKRKQLHDIMFQATVDAEWTEIFNIKRSDPFAIIVVNTPFLIETSNYKEVDTVVVVASDKNLMVERLMQRDKMPKEMIEAIIESQTSEEEKKACADYIIDNNGSLRELRQKTKDLYKVLESDRK